MSNARTHADAAPSPMLNGGWNDMRYVYQAATHVSLPGPPCVMAMISSKTMNPNVVRRISVTAMIGMSSGSVMRAKVSHADAPSTEAAS